MYPPCTSCLEFPGALAVENSALSLLWHGFDPGVGTSTYCKLGQKKKKKKKHKIDIKKKKKSCPPKLYFLLPPFNRIQFCLRTYMRKL